ncbi:Sialidase [Dactylonectria estremocensis]|uniref:Sialidase n=1 Tax=Dactylonectria estremocensis TaxID=1079267 RepID=A0A9P9CZ69_9HYPO|nr:Sialidase [Dactylonectria estremocensis]
MRNADKLPNGVVTTTTGRILTFAEGRRHNNRDYGDVNLVYKRTKTTKSHGESPGDWDALREVVGKGDGTWGNPTPVVDGSTIYLFLSWNHGAYSQNGGDTLPSGKKTKKINNSWEGRRHIFLTQSADDGKTWSEPVDMTKQLTPDGWPWDAVGPGIGITLYSGELVVPAQRRNIIGRAGSEGTIAQTPDGRLYRNDRASADDDYRKVSRGSPSTFSPFVLDKGLPDPACEASTLLYNKKDANGPARTLFMNSAHKSSRRHMRVRISYDGDAKKFNYGRKLSDAPISGVGFEGGYSSLTKTADRKVGALVETDFYQAGGSEKDHRAIVWRRFNLSWILNSPNN